MIQIEFLTNTKEYSFKSYTGHEMVGDIMQITDFALQYGIDQKQLELAYLTMSSNFDTLANFNAMGEFQFSEKTMRLH